MTNKKAHPKKSRLECPKCIGILEENTIGNLEGRKIIIDVCWNCTGIWMDRGELEKALKLKYKTRRTASPWMNPESIDIKKDDAKCPRCKVKMERTPSARNFSVIIDCCPQCIGVWLDGGELGILQRGGYLKRIKDWILRRHARNVTQWKTSYRQPRPS